MVGVNGDLSEAGDVTACCADGATLCVEPGGLFGLPGTLRHP